MLWGMDLTGNRHEAHNDTGLNVPPGLSGRQRQMYLTLTDDQKRVYHYEWFTRGRLAQHCYNAATAPEVRS